MEEFGFRQEDLDRLRQMNELQNFSSESLKNYYEIIKKIRQTNTQISHIEQERRKNIEKLKNLEEKLLDLEAQGLDIEDEAYALVLNQIRARRELVNEADNAIRKGKAQNKLLAEALNRTNLLAASTRTLGQATAVVGKKLSDQTGYLLDQQKAIKKSELSMGILSKQADAFRGNIYKASLSSTELGIGAKELAEIQGTYSEQVGKSIELTERGLIAMSELANGTILTADGAAQLAAEMENFGKSAEASRDYLDEMLNTAHKMGINGAKFTKNLQKNLQIAQKYNFKGGVEGIGKMVLLASKFKIEMSSIAGFAEKVYSPEGAIETAANLQVLGGAWSQLADPFELMFKANNDLAGLTESIKNATKGTAQWNNELGEAVINGLEMRRLREIAKSTAIPFEELAKTAKEVAKFGEIRKMLGGFDEEDKDYIETLAQFNNKTKKFELELDGTPIELEKLTSENKKRIKLLKNEDATLKERAKQAQNFDETWLNIVNMFKSTLLPGFNAFAKSLESGLMGFQKWMVDNDIANKLVSFGKWMGETAATIVRFIADNPYKAIGAGILALVAKESLWFLRGKALGWGFNTVANASGGAGGLLGGGGRSPRTPRGGGGRGFGGAIGKGLGNGLLLGGLSMGADYGRTMLDDPNTDFGKSLGISSKALAWGATGAMLGSIIPGLGTATGAVLGAGAGALAGYFEEYGQNSNTSNQQNGDYDFGRVNNDFISRPGKDPIPFNSADTLVGLKKDGGLGKALIDNKGSKKADNVSVTFANSININGSIDLKSGNGTTSLDLNNPLFIRELSKLISEEVTRSMNGGRISSNPLN